MDDKLVKCRVKGPKGMWVNGVCEPEGTKIELSQESYESKLRRGNVYAIGEFEGIEAAKEAALKASQEEKDARNIGTEEVAKPSKSVNKPSSMPKKAVGSK